MLFRFEDPAAFLLIMFIPLFIYFYRKFEKNRPGMIYSVLESYSDENRIDFATYFYHSLFILKILGFVLIVIALARPQRGFEEHKVIQKSVDIVLTLDASGSMMSTDFKPTRFTVAKNVLLEFVDKMEENRMALVVFSQTAFTQCPLTFDHDIVKELIELIDINSIRMNRSTAIGDAIMVSINRFKLDDKTNKVIILLTDGQNNAGHISPMKAAAIARKLKIKIYTIGVGTPEGTYYYGQKTRVDEKTLRKIAVLTKGMYFSAEDPQALSEVYDKISKMEKQKIEQLNITKYSERFPSFVIAGLLIFVVAVILRKFLFAGV